MDEMDKTIFYLVGRTSIQDRAYRCLQALFLCDFEGFVSMWSWLLDPTASPVLKAVIVGVELDAEAHLVCCITSGLRWVHVGSPRDQLGSYVELFCELV